MRKRLPLFFLFFFVLCLAWDGNGQGVPARPNPPRLVNDFAGTMSPEEVQQLESLLVRFNDSTSTQIVVVTLQDLGGYDKNDLAFRIGESWGVGQKGKNNGIVILVKPKTGSEKGEAAISVAYGLEGAIPDAIAKRIVDHEMIPSFRQGDYFQGILSAANTLISLSKGEFTADQYDKRTQNDAPYGMLVPIIVIGLVFFLVRASRARSYSVGKSLPFWTAFWLLGNMGHRTHSGTWNNFTSGGGGFGGFGGGGGGGFGGFGGGSFGGGGAGGSW